MRARWRSTPTAFTYYPFVLGAQPVRPLDIARYYAAIANEGVLPEPHLIETISDRAGDRFDYGPPQDQADQIGGCGCVLSAQVHSAGRGPARHCSATVRLGSLYGGQDRHHR